MSAAANDPVIELKLPLSGVNLALRALDSGAGGASVTTTARLIGDIQGQAQAQLNPPPPAPPADSEVGEA